MRFVADSSLLVRLYLHDRNSEAIERFLAADAKVVSLPALARIEVLNVLLRQESRAGQFLADLAEGVRLRLEPVDWPKAFQQAARAFGKDNTPLKILVVPALPQAAAARDESIALLRSKGIDAVLPFRTMLAELVNKTEVNRNYQKSDLLQIIRILKNYDLCQEPQLELFRTKGKKPAPGKNRKAQP